MKPQTPKIPSLRRRAALVWCLFALAPALPARNLVRVAVAANLASALDPLQAAFAREHPDITVQTSLGSSGGLVAQIIHGAPFDVFLSADIHYPEALISAGQADVASLTPYATGRLVFWTARPDFAFTTLEEALSSPALRRLAIANPDTAPYGRAARQTLAKLGRWVQLQPRLVFGENISQTLEFVASGNADAGFVALSEVLAPALRGKGHWLVVPDEDHAPLTQGAVLTLRGAGNPAARAYLAFLTEPAATAVLRNFGYLPPTRDD